MLPKGSNLRSIIGTEQHNSKSRDTVKICFVNYTDISRLMYVYRKHWIFGLRFVKNSVGVLDWVKQILLDFSTVFVKNTVRCLYCVLAKNSVVLGDFVFVKNIVEFLDCIFIFKKIGWIFLQCPLGTRFLTQILTLFYILIIKNCKDAFIGLCNSDLPLLYLSFSINLFKYCTGTGHLRRMIVKF
jgi:hypothetical protein